MPFVKLDTGILNSTLWFEKACRDVFITALLMAEPRELREPQPQIHARSLELTGFTVPPGWYGFIETAGVGIIGRALVEPEAGMAALDRLGEPDQESRSNDYQGRRLVRVNGGYIVLNYMRYRDKDYSGAERQKRFRDRKKQKAATTTVTRDALHSVTPERHASREITHSRVQSTGVTPPLASPPVVQGGGGEDGEPEVQDIKSVTWAAYERAYITRWGARPLRDAKANSLIVSIVKRLGQVAPAVAAFYVGSNRGLYVSAKHDLTLLLRDANGLNTEWATGTRVSDTEARQGDKTAGNANAFLPLIEAARRQEGER